MPHGSSSGDDFASTDEVKIYKEEGEEENKSSAENLSEEKIGLLTETEQGKGLTHSSATNCFNISDCQIGFGSCLADYYSFHSRIPFGYHTLLNPYSYATGSAIPGLNNVPTILPPSPWFYMCNNNHCAQGPQSHMGLPPPPPPPAPPPPPPIHIGSRTGYSPSSSMYHIPGAPPSHQLSHLFVSREFSPISCFDQFSRSNHAPYPLPFGSPYLPSMMSGSSLGRLNAGDYFSSQPPHPPPPPHHHRHHHHHHSHPPPLNIPCPGVSHPTLVCPYPAEDDRRKSSESAAEGSNSRQMVWFPLGRSSENSKPKSSSIEKSASSTQSSSDAKVFSRRMHIKKPLNAFMLFMKEMRSKVVDECTLKESAAINQILGRKWHSLNQSEQNKYYEMARKEKLLHRQKFPGWSARDNYATQIRKKRKREQMNQLNRRMMSRDEDRETSTSKKCRARYGLDQQHRWCKPCRRKKRCIRFLDDDDTVGTEDFHDDSSSQMPTVDSTVNESHLFISMPSSTMTSSTLDTDCMVSEPIAPKPSRSLSTPGHGHHVTTCEDFPMTFQCYPKKSLVSSWSDGASSSIGSPSQQHMSGSSAIRTHESNRKMLSSSLHSTS